MSSSQSIQLKHKLTQLLTQAQQQSLRVLQMSAMELDGEVADWLDDNPLLERQENLEESLTPDVTAAVSVRHMGVENADDIWANIAEEDSFTDYLHKQVCEHPLTEQTAACVHLLIDFLDEHGYFTETLSEVLNHVPLTWQVDEEDLQAALDHLQQFDPPGVAASGLIESLLLQLQRLPADDARRCAVRIVARYFDHLEQGRARNVAFFQKAWPEEEVAVIEAALDLISELTPYPSYGFSGSEPTAYVQPDVIVREGKAGWEVVANRAAVPNLVINQDLADAVSEAGQDDDNVWKAKLQEAKQHIESLNQRRQTVEKIAQYIVSKQEDFFVFGEIGLVPMMMKDCAAALGLSESTVSRAVNHKYLACPRGVFKLRYFFSHAVSENHEDQTSQNAVKAMIAELVRQEDKAKPYSDETLVNLLAQQGITVARRTIAKYRDSLNIPSAHKRRI